MDNVQSQIAEHTAALHKLAYEKTLNLLRCDGIVKEMIHHEAVIRTLEDMPKADT